MNEHIEWQSVALGIGLVGIAAYFLWTPPTAQQVLTGSSDPAPDVQSVAYGDSLAQPYLSVNRPKSATPPDSFPALASWADPTINTGVLALPDGLYEQPDGTITGGSYIGGSYVGDQITINNPGAYANGSDGPGNACGCG